MDWPPGTYLARVAVWPHEAFGAEEVGDPIRDLLTHSCPDFDGIPVLHAAVHPRVDDFSPQIVSVLEDTRRPRHHAVENETDSLGACVTGRQKL